MAGWKRASDIGIRVRAAREALGLDQSQLAEGVGVYQQTVSDWETGRTSPSRSRISFLARKYGFPMEVFGEGGPMPDSLAGGPLGSRSEGVVAPAQVREGGGFTGILRESTIAEMDPRQVVRAAALAIADYRATAGEDMPFERLTWWLGKVFEAGGRETRRALAALEGVNPDR